MEIEGKVTYDAAISSAKHGTWIRLVLVDEYAPQGKDRKVIFVHVENVSALHGPPAGPWFQLTVRDAENKRYPLDVHAANSEGESCKIRLR